MTSSSSSSSLFATGVITLNGGSVELSPSVTASFEAFAIQAGKIGLRPALTACAVSFEEKTNNFFVAVLSLAMSEEVHRLSANDAGKYPASSDTVKSILALCGERGTARDYCGRVLRAFWNACQVQGNVILTGSFRDLVKLGRKTDHVILAAESAAADVAEKSALAYSEKIQAEKAEQENRETEKRQFEQALEIRIDTLKANFKTEREIFEQEIQSLKAEVARLNDHINTLSAAKPESKKKGTTGK